MSTDVMTPAAVANLEAYRRRKDAKHADDIDSRFFLRNPDRLFHVRPSLPTEQKSGADRERVNNACIMLIDRHTAKVERYFLPLNLAVIPDDEAFLAWLWVKMKIAFTEGKTLSINPLEHKQMLIETGHWKEPANG